MTEQEMRDTIDQNLGYWINLNHDNPHNKIWTIKRHTTGQTTKYIAGWYKYIDKISSHNELRPLSIQAAYDLANALYSEGWIRSTKEGLPIDKDGTLMPMPDIINFLNWCENSA